MIWLIPAAIAALMLIFALWFVYECWTAPTINEYGRVVADPYGRLGPSFNEGDPIPDVHEGKRYL